MNAGEDYYKARAHAQANADATHEPWMLWQYNGVWWVERAFFGHRGTGFETIEPKESVEPAKLPRGFAAMSPEQRRAIASKGGKAAHAKGTGRQWTIMEARAAGKKGGIISRGGRGKL